MTQGPPPTRRRALKLGGALALAGLTGGGSFLTIAPARASIPPLSKVEAWLQRLEKLEGATPEGQSLFQTLVHCAQSLELSLTGFPEPKPAWFRSSVGPLVARYFLASGRMSHNLAAPIPGAPAVPREGHLAEAFARLRHALSSFEEAVRAGAGLRPHFAYGEVAPDDFARLQVLHLADHLSTIPGVIAPTS